MKRYEYKFVETPAASWGFDQQKKLREAEAQWNRLGQEGWQFCKEGNGCMIFMREIPENTKA